jgi:hypothetical protein
MLDGCSGMMVTLGSTSDLGGFRSWERDSKSGEERRVF